MQRFEAFRSLASDSQWDDPAAALLLIVRRALGTPSTRQFRTSTDGGEYVLVPPLSAVLASPDTLAAPLRKRENSPYAEFIFVGRSTTADVQLEDASISKSHAAFQRHGEEWFVKDVRSRNGTYVDGTRLELGGRVALRSGAQVTFGAVPAYFAELPHLRRLLAG
jgi:hypothetical protein